MGAELLVVGASHRTAPLELREKLAVAADDIPGALAALTALPSVAEAVLLSTCNRVEIYVATSGDVPRGAAAAVEELRAFLAERAGVTPAELTPHLYERPRSAAVTHAFRVASSLDSLVVGEPQILGQLKDAFRAALAAGTVGPLLGRCLERAFGAAKRVRTETQLARGGANVSSVAVELARSIFGNLGGRRVLVLGAGKMADLAARHLAADGAAEILVANRSAERAEKVAAAVGGAARPWDELEALLTAVDIVICSTGSQLPVIGRDLLKRVMKARRYRPLFLVDIAVPRDVEESAGTLDGVYLYDVDDLEEVVAGNLGERQAEADAAERIVEAEAAVFLAWLRQQEVVPTIKQLRQCFLDIAHAEAERAITGLAGSTPLTEEQERHVRHMAETIANKLLKNPLLVLKAETGETPEALVTAARRLFALVPDEEKDAITG